MPAYSPGGACVPASSPTSPRNTGMLACASARAVNATESATDTSKRHGNDPWRRSRRHIGIRDMHVLYERTESALSSATIRPSEPRPHARQRTLDLRPFVDQLASEVRVLQRFGGRTTSPAAVPVLPETAYGFPPSAAETSVIAF